MNSASKPSPPMATLIFRLLMPQRPAVAATDSKNSPEGGIKASAAHGITHFLWATVNRPSQPLQSSLLPSRPVRQQKRHQVIEIRRRNDFAKIFGHERSRGVALFDDVLLRNRNLLACDVGEHHRLTFLAPVQA